MQKPLDYYWNRRIRTLSATIEKYVSEFDKGIVDWDRKKLPKSKLRHIRQRLKSEFHQLSRISTQLKKREPNLLIQQYYRRRIKELQIRIKIWQTKYDLRLSGYTRNNRVTELIHQLYPLPNVTTRTKFINEFIAFVSYSIEHNFADISSLPDIHELTKPAFYGVKQAHIDATPQDFKESIDKYKLSRASVLPGTTLSPAQTRRVLESFCRHIKLHGIKTRIDTHRELFYVEKGRTIGVPGRTSTTWQRITKIIVHEILVHVFRAKQGACNRNAAGRQLRMLENNLSQNLYVEEGIASYFEQQTFYESCKVDVPNLINFYLRIIAVQLGIEFEPDILKQKLLLVCRVQEQIEQDKTAIQIRNTLTNRLHRGMHNPGKGHVHTKIAQYLVGNRYIWEFIERGGNVYNLFAGKITPDQLELLREAGFYIPEDIEELKRDYVLEVVERYLPGT
ncbi:MAG: tyrosine/phenylalanine carboxypeptidase domain-containing protein [Candidatus Dojkabacteria bacterium]